MVADGRLDERAALAHRLDWRRDAPPTQAELILHAWLKWGADCAEPLRGDFAFAVWDPRARRVFCARDIMGVRPLYIHHQPGRLFAFASRAQALLALPDVPDDLDEGRIADALTTELEGVDKTCTFYRAIQRLPPAHSVSVGGRQHTGSCNQHPAGAAAAATGDGAAQAPVGPSGPPAAAGATERGPAGAAAAATGDGAAQALVGPSGPPAAAGATERVLARAAAAATGAAHHGVAPSPLDRAFRPSCGGAAEAATETTDRCDIRCWWRLEPDRVVLPRGDREWTEAVTAVLEQAIARHLDGAARVGSMLSGGMDSSSLAVLAADQLRKTGKGPLPTFSSLDTPGGDTETRAVLAMARLPGFQPYLIESAAIAAEREAFAESAWDSDDPFDPDMVLLDAQYRAAARAGVDAVIDGGLGDVVFASGGSMVRQMRRFQWLALGRNVWGTRWMDPGASVSRELIALARGAFVPEWLRRLRRRLRGQRDGARVCEVLASSIMAPALASRVDLRARLARFDAWSSGPARGPAEESVRRLGHTFNTCGIERYHRVAARHGVDPRDPFADRDVLELLVNLPDRQRLREGWTKAALREAMRGRLPEPVRTRCDKHHLGWSLIGRVLLPDAAEVRATLAAQRPLLEPYLDWAKLDAALAHWNDPDARLGKHDVLMALDLGHWLARQPAR